MQADDYLYCLNPREFLQIIFKHLLDISNNSFLFNLLFYNFLFLMKALNLLCITWYSFNIYCESIQFPNDCRLNFFRIIKKSIQNIILIHSNHKRGWMGVDSQLEVNIYYKNSCQLFYYYIEKKIFYFIKVKRKHLRLSNL